MSTGSRPALTVVTTSKGLPRDLERTLRSIKLQRLRGLELLVVEANDDVEPGIREQINDLDARLLTSVGGGPYPAMNRGLNEASGDAVCFLNSGDWFNDESSAERLVELLADDEWGYGATALVGEGGEICRVVRPKVPLWRLRLGLAFIPHPSTVVRREILQEVGGFDARLGISADQGVAMRLARRAYPRTTQAVIAKLKLGGMSTGRTGFQVAKEFQECRRQAGWCLPPAGVIDTAATIGVGALRVTYGLAGKFR